MATEFTFGWDPKKAAANLRKHRIGFPEAITAFADPLSLTAPDPDHSSSEDRFVLIGLSRRNHLLVVAHVELGNHIRIINARLATRAERKAYEEA
jgi:uncharacterized DUF497 family protein